MLLIVNSLLKYLVLIVMDAFVSIGRSSDLVVVAGVSQGSVLGRVLFLLIIKDIR